MAAYTNPPLLSEAPADGQTIQFDAATGQWNPIDIADAGAITVPGTHIAPETPTSSQNATTNASAPSVGYVQAEAASTATLANALKVSYNAAQVDVAALATKLNTLLTELQTAGILAAS